MSDPRHLLLLACTLAFAVSCARRPMLARSQPLTDLNRPSANVEFEPLTNEPGASNPYAPIRARNANVYSWQSETRAVCTPEARSPQSGVERPLAPTAALGVLAALPERTSD
ncbi:MAG TPA: hypothetical protein VGC79_18365, partial [Polyangiaceae bacterium]